MSSTRSRGKQAKRKRLCHPAPVKNWVESPLPTLIAGLRLHPVRTRFGLHGRRRDSLLMLLVYNALNPEAFLDAGIGAFVSCSRFHGRKQIRVIEARVDGIVNQHHAADVGNRVCTSSKIVGSTDCFLALLLVPMYLKRARLRGEGSSVRTCNNGLTDIIQFHKVKRYPKKDDKKCCVGVFFYSS